MSDTETFVTVLAAATEGAGKVEYSSDQKAMFAAWALPRAHSEAPATPIHLETRLLRSEWLNKFIAWPHGRVSDNQL
ncbi:hypothetical protein GCM10027195_16950 [Comamonas sediminis]